ncbi:MAG: hypothetical protein KGM99_11280 [Burkholderiales bacterium]|nr:hypothetical protein [Burkholderiales bacterium]
MAIIELWQQAVFIPEYVISGNNKEYRRYAAWRTYVKTRKRADFRQIIWITAFSTPKNSDFSERSHIDE